MKKGLYGYMENDDGSIRIRYEDYKVGCFGGGDYEAIYEIDAANREKLENLLRKSDDDNLEDLIVEEFGEYLDKKSFAEYLNENDIKYGLFTF